MRFLLWLLFLSVLLGSSCIERFEPEVKNFKSLLVVDGFISDRNEPYSIKLSRTTPVDDSNPLPETGASVVVADAEGAEFEFAEASPGVYLSNPNQFTGIVNASYQLRIETRGGVSYLSEWVALKSSPAIDNVYWEREERVTDEAGVTTDGAAIFVGAHDTEGNTRYYRYDFIETYEIRPYYPSGWGVSEVTGEFGLRDPKVSLCFNSDTSQAILVTNTISLAEDRVSRHEVSYVGTEGYRLSGLYSILVRQYALDEKGFKYWSELQKTSETQGTLFDPQPYELRGNISNPADPEEAVLGLFDAGTVSEKRLYISKEELRELNVNYPRDPCRNELDSVKTAEEYYLFTTWGHLLVSIDPVTMIPPECGDCRYHGTLEKPEFWPQ